MDGSDVGYNIYSIVVSDLIMNTAMDTVTLVESPVMVDDPVPTDTNTEPGLFGLSWLSLFLTIGATGVIVVFVFLIVRTRK